MAVLEVLQCLVASDFLKTASQVPDGPTCSQWEDEDQGMDEEGVVGPDDGDVASIEESIGASVVIAGLSMMIEVVISGGARTNFAGYDPVTPEDQRDK